MMHVVRKVSEVRPIRWKHTGTWGFVPTMGALHEGHLSLVRRAREENDRVGVSIFVNPIQFDNQADLDAYPHTFEGDVELLRERGVNLVWAPSVEEMYPPGFQTYVNVQELTQPLEGAHRPGHFSGVTTVVAKLFNVFQPTRAYFGQKDAQQAAVIRQMARDLAFNLSVVVCPIVREADGLALSSRNVRLKGEERRAATVLYRSLQAARAEWLDGERNADHLRETIQTLVDAEPLARIDYVSLADPDTLQEIEGEAEKALASMAVFIGETRLIDNVILGEGE
jgi:pantoate--beta-alanine ligase